MTGAGAVGLVQGAATDAEADAPSRERPRTIVLFACLVAGTIAAQLIFDRQMAHGQIYERLMQGRMGAAGMSNVMEAARQVALLGYLATPVTVLLRLAITALYLQLLLLAAHHELRFANLLRVLIIAGGVNIVKMLAHAIALGRLAGGPIPPAALIAAPGSLAPLAARWDLGVQFVVFFGEFNWFELAWCAIVVIGLCRRGVPRVIAVLSVLALWLSIALGQLGMTSYLSGAAH